MARADRLERLDVRRLDLETDYRAALVEALGVTASGVLGLFAHNGDRHSSKAVLAAVENLNELGQDIDRMREQLALPPFELHRQFIASRGPVGPQAVGEARQAQAWLDRLSAEEATKP